MAKGSLPVKASTSKRRAIFSSLYRKHANMAKGRRPQRNKSGQPSGLPRFWGRHAVGAALDNPERRVRKIWATRETAAQFDIPSDIPVSFCDAGDLGRMVAIDAPHQGIVAEVDPLEDLLLAELLDQNNDNTRPLLILDQVTDPHNIGAILRSAAAFDAIGVVTQDRHSPSESGTIARAAAGALEIVPWVRVVNLARALEEVAEAGFWRIGLDGEAEQTLAQAIGTSRVCLVLGAEGEGMRRNTIEHCDIIAKLPINEAMESLNVSNAAAISLYAVATAK